MIQNFDYPFPNKVKAFELTYEWKIYIGGRYYDLPTRDYDLLKLITDSRNKLPQTTKR